MKKHYLLIAIIALFGTFMSADKAKASHATGGELIYIHLGDSAYQFILKFYRDCSGATAPNEFTLCAYNTFTNASFTIPMPLYQGTLPPDNRPNGSPVSPGCSGANTRCDNPPGSVPGYQEYWFECVIPRLPFHTQWRFGALGPGWSPANPNPGILCCRNVITNIPSASFYLETGFNSTYTWDNSSPYYSIKPVPYVCLGQSFTFNNGALDADGDSLWSYLIQPLQTPHCSAAPVVVPYKNGSPTYNTNNNPFQTNNTFFLNGANGQFGFSSQLTGAGAITTQTDEYARHGLPTTRVNVPSYRDTTYKIGYIMRDVQVQTIACSTILPQLDTFSIESDSGAFINGVAYGCIGQELNFCMVVSSSDTETILKVSDNIATIQTMLGAQVSYQDQGTDSVKVCFTWTPQASNVGLNSVVLLIRDSTCKPPGILFNYAYTVDINVWGPISGSENDTICKGEPAFLGVTGGGKYSWTTLSGTPNSLNDTSIAAPIGYPQESTVYLVKSTLNDYCKTGITDTVNVNVIVGTEITGQPDDTTCPDHPLQLDLGMTKESGITYNINWTPNTGLDNDKIENPVTTLKEPIQYIATITSNKNRCVTSDTMFIDVLSGLSVDNPDTAICFGEEVEVRGAADTRYDIKWTSLDMNALYTDPGLVGTSIQPSDTGTYSYVVTGSYFKCTTGPDTIAEFKIEVEPVPVVEVNEDNVMCQGDTMQLDGIVIPGSYGKYTYSWTPGAMLDFPDRTNPIFSATDIGDFTLNFKVTTPSGCTDDADINLEVFTAKFITLPEDTAICPGDSIAINMNIQEGSQFYWLPDYNISSISSVAPRVWPVADQEYTVYGIDSFGCLDTQTVRIDVRPRAIMDMPDSVVIYPGESYRVDPGGNCLYYTWFPPLGLSDADVSNPLVSPKVNTRYIVHGRTEAGCSVTDSLDVLIKNDGFLNLPNAFTPGLRSNSTLKIMRRGIANLKTFAVYNRWGTKVFETSDINEGWDGTYNGEMQPMGVYVYTIEAVSSNGQIIQKQGNVTLIK